MSSEDLLEFSLNQLQTLKATLKQYKTLIGSLGATPTPTPSSPANSTKIHKLRSQYLELEDKLNKSIAGNNNSNSREWEALRKEAKQVRDDFLRADKVVQVHHYEDQKQTNGAASSSSSSGVSLQQMKKVNTAGLETEAEYQRQRLDGIRDIEQSANEVREMFHDFNTMVKLQQGGLDTVVKNLDKATNHVRNGTEEIKKARKM